MPLEVHKCEESDIADFVRIQVDSFDYGGGITAILAPTPRPDDYISKNIDKHLKSLKDERDVTYLKVIDTDLGGKMIAGAKWRINEKERSEEEVKKTLPVPGKDEEGRLGVQDFMWFLNRARWQYMKTKPFYFLHILATDPEHHRRGAGAMLLAWGLKKADGAGLPSFLESSPMGRPLYARFGFTPREEVHWDLSKYGFEGSDTSTIMIRDPLPSQDE
ncbi:hypothetical protein ACN47E_001074 [Coniothyrium glycines]